MRPVGNWHWVSQRDGGHGTQPNGTSSSAQARAPAKNFFFKGKHKLARILFKIKTKKEVRKLNEPPPKNPTVLRTEKKRQMAKKHWVCY